MSRLATLFHVEPGEGRLVALLFALSFSLGAANNFLQAAAFALFMVEFDARALAVVYIANALVLPLLTLVYLRLGQRLSFAQLLAANLAFLLLIIAVFRLGLAAPVGPGTARWLLFALPILFQVVVNFGNLVFWTLAGRLLNVRQGKRLFGLVGAGLWLALVITGLLIPFLVTWLGTANLLLLSAGAVAGAWGLARYITRAFVAPVPRSPAEQQPASAGGLKSRYIILLLTLTVLWWVGYFFIDNIFYYQAEVVYPDAAQLASFLGVFLAAQGLVALLGNTLLTGWVIGRYGVRVSLVILPALIVGGAGAMVLTETIGAAVTLLFGLTLLTKLLDMAVGFSIDRSAQTILYQPLPAEQRGRTQALAEGIFQPLANGLAGVALLLLGALWAGGTLPLMVGLVLVAGAWLGVAVLLGREYPAMLVRALARRRLDSVDLPLEDPVSRAVLRRALHDPHPGAALYALNTLAALDDASFPDLVVELLTHPAPAVRQEALRHVEQLGATRALPAVRQRIAVEPAPAVRGAAVRALAALGGDPAFAEVAAFLQDPDPLVRRGAMVGLLRSGGIAGVLAAGHQLLQMAAAPEPAERVLAAQVLGAVGVGGFYQPLIPLLQDEDRPVQRAALLAAGEVGDAHLWPLVLDQLGAPALRRVAAVALVAGGEAVVPALVAAFDRPGQTPAVQAQLARIAGRIGGAQALNWLQDQLAHPDAGVRTAVLGALDRCGYQAAPAEIARVQEQIAAEAALAAEIRAMLADIGAGEAVALLRAALVEALAQGRARLLLLLSFLYDRRAIRSARDALGATQPAAEKRAYALEVLDVLVAPELRRVIWPLLTDLPPDPQSQRDCQPCLQAIIAGPPGRFSAWTRACALYAAGRLSATTLRETVTAALDAPEPLVRETAAWAGRRLTETGPEETMLSTLEKVIALKKASIFAETPDEILAPVAALLEEVSLRAGDRVFEKGELGQCLYIIVDGAVRVHDGEHTLNRLQAGDVFGEMAVLDAAPRMASVTAEVDTLLLRLAQEPLYEVLEDRDEVARGIIRVLSQRLRAQSAVPEGSQ